MSIGERLKAERERLGFNQTQFAALVSASKKSQIRWEQDSGGYPDAEALATWVEAGLDAVYVLTGERSTVSGLAQLRPDEQLLLEAYRGLSPAKRKQLLASLLVGKVANSGSSGNGISVSGSGNRTAGRDYHE